jgi:hypothetical protein
LYSSERGFRLRGSSYVGFKPEALIKENGKSFAYMYEVLAVIEEVRRSWSTPVLPETGRIKKHPNMNFGEERVIEKFLTIQHRLNPLHVYCRFLDRGLSRRLSFSLCKSYEVLIFIWISFLIKAVVYFYSIMNRNFKIQEELKRR